MAKKQLIRLTEGDLHNIIKESVNRILENNYKNHFNKMKVAQHLKGKNNDEKGEEWREMMAKMQALNDINKYRSVSTMSPHEQQFNNIITKDTFDIDFDALNDEL